MSASSGFYRVYRPGESKEANIEGTAFGGVGPVLALQVYGFEVLKV